MKILVTGADGFIGSHLCDYLLDLGHEVTGVGLGQTVVNLSEALARPNFRFVALDLTRADPPPGEYACLCHLAALAGTAPSWGRFEDYLARNILLTQRLLVWAVGHKVNHVLHVSSSSVYGGEVTWACTEGAPCHPVSPYGVTKLAGEALVGAYAQAHGLQTAVVRPFSVYGPRQRPDMFVNILIARALAGQPVRLEGDGEQERSFTYVGDLVRAFGLLLNYRHSWAGEAYNVGGGEVASVNRLVDLVGRLLDQDIAVEHVPPRLGDQRLTFANTRALRALTGWSPVMGLWEGLGAQVAWQRARLGKVEPCCSWK